MPNALVQYATNTVPYKDRDCTRSGGDGGREWKHTHGPALFLLS